MEPKLIEYWTAWNFSRNEYRLCGYVFEGGEYRCIVTEQITSVGENGIVHTKKGDYIPTGEPLKLADRMDTMYNLGRWCQLNEKREPSDASLEVLADIKEKKECLK